MYFPGGQSERQLATVNHMRTTHILSQFPGCFYCDTSARMYKVAVSFHFACSFFAGVLALSFVAKLILARQVVIAELSSPTTASPAGLLCMTLDVVFAGRGLIGMLVVSTSSFIHLCLAIWFLYLAMAYHTMPEPSWFPSTSGLGVSAVKTYLYYPIAGHFLMAVSSRLRQDCFAPKDLNRFIPFGFYSQVSLSLAFVFFPISLIRVYFNRKISATVGKCSCTGTVSDRTSLIERPVLSQDGCRCQRRMWRCMLSL
jgi:hypothetical protein